MAVPKRKVTPSRKKIRNTAIIEKIRKSFYNYATCSNCNFIKKKHTICNYCGYYKDSFLYK